MREFLAAAVPTGRDIPITMDVFADRVLKQAETGLVRKQKKLWRQHLDARKLRGALWALDTPPWEKTALTDNEWDLQWRLSFGGLSDLHRSKLDHAKEDTNWRGRIMEHVFANEVKDAVPGGVVHCSMQPGPEFRPPDHLARCAAEGVSPEAWRRADVAVEVIGSRPQRMVVDVGTTNVLSATALKSNVQDHMEGIWSKKVKHYKAYYAEFTPFVVSLSGGVPESSWAVLRRISKWGASANHPRLDWEADAWAVRALRGIAAAMARVSAWLLTRTFEGTECGGRLATLTRRRGHRS